MSVILLALNVIAIVNIAILCVFLCSRKNNILPNYILAFILAIPGFYFIDNILIVSDYIYKWPYTFFISQIIAIAFPITVYYYVHLLLDRKPFHYILLCGSLILLAYIIYLTILFSQLSWPDKTAYIKQLNTDDAYPLSMLEYTTSFYVWQMLYFIILMIEIIKYQRNAESSFSNFESIKIDYIKRFMYLLGALNLGLIIFYITMPMPIVDYGILPIVVTIIYGFIMFNTVKYNAVFDKKSYDFLVQENQQIIAFETQNIQPSEKDISPQLIDSKIQELGKKIEALLSQNKIFTQPDLKLKFIAEQLHEPDYIVSKALNQYFHKSFYELINEQRIKQAEKLLLNFDTKKDTIEGLAYQVGFNSRAAFYRSFKKYTGKNPSDYIL
jgi:AraC-like DNA-binding protein